MNYLLLEATGVYVKWLNTWLNVDIYKKAVGLARERAEGSKALLISGNRPAIDTLEAVMLLQSLHQKLTEYQTLLMNYKNDLSAYLWHQDLKPDTSGVASRFPDERLLTLEVPDRLLKKSSTLINSNPELKNYGLKRRPAMNYQTRLTCFLSSGRII